MANKASKAKEYAKPLEKIESVPPLPPQPPVDEQNQGLALSDIQNAVKIIDYACDKGAFTGWQVIDQVLTVRNKLNTFITAAEAAQKQDVSDAAEAAAKQVKSV